MQTRIKLFVIPKNGLLWVVQKQLIWEPKIYVQKIGNLLFAIKLKIELNTSNDTCYIQHVSLYSQDVLQAPKSASAPSHREWAR